MNISSRCEYACRAAIELAKVQSSQSPLPAVQIAERRAIPEKYLVHILLQLKRAGIVRSVRGAQGGYILAHAPEQVSLGDVVRAVDGPVLDPLPVDDDGGADLRPVWKQVAENVESAMAGITLRDILDASAQENMYYI